MTPLERSELLNYERALGIQVQYRELPSLPRPIGLVLFWLVPALSLTVFGVGGKLLSDADLTWKATEATAGPRAILRTVEGSEDATAPRPEAAETSAPVSALSGVGRNAREIASERSTTANSAPVRDRRRSAQPLHTPMQRPSAQPLHTPMQRPFSMEWRIPSRLTDGF